MYIFILPRRNVYIFFSGTWRCIRKPLRKREYSWWSLLLGGGSLPRDEVLAHFFKYRLQSFWFEHLILFHRLDSERGANIYFCNALQWYLFTSSLSNQSIYQLHTSGCSKTIHPISMYLVTRKPITLPETNIPPKIHWKMTFLFEILHDFAYFQGRLPSVPGRATHPPKVQRPVFLWAISLVHLRSPRTFLEASKQNDVEGKMFREKKMEDDLFFGGRFLEGKIFKVRCLEDFP